MTTQYEQLRRLIDDVQVGLAIRLDDLGARLDTMQDDLAAIKARLALVEYPRIDPDFVAERLGLTPNEGRVAASLAEGNTVREIAETTGRTVGTVRFILKQAYRKAGVPTQAQLVRRVLLLPHGMSAPVKSGR